MKDYCNSCQYCKKFGYLYCDKCNCRACIDCINEHIKYIDLVSSFSSKVDKALQYISKSVNSLDDDLRNKDIYVIWTSNVEDYLDNMKYKKSEIEDDYSNYNLDDIRSEYDIKFFKVEYQFEDELAWIEKKFIDRKEILIRKMEDIRNYYNNELNSKINTRNNLQNTLNQTRINNPIKKEQELNNYKSQLKSNAEMEYSQKKQIIDENPNYKKSEIKLEYSEEEKNMINQYTNEINKIYEYSKVIPEELINNILN